MTVLIQHERQIGLDSLSVSEVRSAIVAIKESEVGKPFWEIADELRIPPSTLSSRITRVEAVFGELFLRGKGGRRMAVSTERGKRLENTTDAALRNLEGLTRSGDEADQAGDQVTRISLDNLSVGEIQNVILAIKESETGKPFSRIADDLRIPPTTLSSRISRLEAVFGALFLCGSGGRRTAASTELAIMLENTAYAALRKLYRQARSGDDTDRVSDTEHLDAARENLKNLRSHRKYDAENARVRAVWEAVPEDERPSCPTPEMYEAARLPKTKRD